MKLHQIHCYVRSKIRDDLFTFGIDLVKFRIEKAKIVSKARKRNEVKVFCF